MSRVNDGSRPSRLDLGRHLAGEVEVDTSAASSQAWLEEVRATRVAPFDFAGIQARAEKTADVVSLFPRRAVQAVLVTAVAMAAAALLVVQPPSTRTKGEDDLDFYVLRNGEVTPGDPSEPVRAGDRLQFAYRTEADHMVLLSVDGSGVATTYFPDEGDAPVPVVPGERHLLEGSILLDDARGPETFVAFYGDTTASEARDATLDAWAEGGLDAVVALGESRADVAVLVLEKQ
jgi:hypothetical protein